MARPDIAARIDALEAAFARRVRLTIANRSAAALNTIKDALDEHRWAESNLLVNSSSVQGQAEARRRQESALRAVALYCRLARYFTPTPAARPQFTDNRKPTPGRGVASRSPHNPRPAADIGPSEDAPAPAPQRPGTTADHAEPPKLAPRTHARPWPTHTRPARRAELTISAAGAARSVAAPFTRAAGSTPPLRAAVPKARDPPRAAP